MLVTLLLLGHKNAKQAKVKLQKYKQSIVAEVSAKSKELMKKALEDVSAYFSGFPICVAMIDILQGVSVENIRTDLSKNGNTVSFDTVENALGQNRPKM